MKIIYENGGFLDVPVKWAHFIYRVLANENKGDKNPTQTIQHICQIFNVEYQYDEDDGFHE
jgi:hypothetical protein